MKFLVLIVVLVIVYMVWRGTRLGRDTDASPPNRGTPGTPQEMIACPVCGLHLPKADAVAGRNGLHYCSQEHRLRAGA